MKIIDQCECRYFRCSCNGECREVAAYHHAHPEHMLGVRLCEKCSDEVLARAALAKVTT